MNISGLFGIFRGAFYAESNAIKNLMLHLKLVLQKIMVEQYQKNVVTHFRKKWLPQQLRKLSHSKPDKLPVDKSVLKKGSDKKSKVNFLQKRLMNFIN